jgi:hypothetical protein
MFNERFEHIYRMNSAAAMEANSLSQFKNIKSNSNFPFLFFLGVGI